MKDFELGGEPSPWKGAAAGFVGGLAASCAMTVFHALAGAASRVFKGGDPLHPQHSVERGQPESARQGARGDDATVRAADRIAREVLGREPSQREREIAGPALHYALGAVTGAAHGALAEVAPGVARGAGVPFGIAVWLAADVIGVPAFGLAPPPTQTPPSVHARALGAHLVYGLTTEAVRRAMRRAL
jgi:hypothetical protein